MVWNAYLNTARECGGGQFIFHELNLHLFVLQKYSDIHWDQNFGMVASTSREGVVAAADVILVELSYQFRIICMSAPLHQLLIAAAKSTKLGSVNDDAGRSGYRGVDLMMLVGHIGESNGRDIRLDGRVYLTIINHDGRVTSDNMMTWGRWVRSNHIGRSTLRASARDKRKYI